MHYLLPAFPPSPDSSIYSLLHSCHLQCTNLSRLYFDMYLPWTFAHVQWPLLYNKYLTFHSALSFYFPVSLPGYIVPFGYIRGFLIVFRPVLYNGFYWISSDNKYLPVFLLLIFYVPCPHKVLYSVLSFGALSNIYPITIPLIPVLHPFIQVRWVGYSMSSTAPLMYSICHASSKFSKPWILIMCPRNFLISLLLSYVFTYSYKKFVDHCWKFEQVFSNLTNVYLKQIGFISKQSHI